ncbi:E3 ubiquitin-protein ligase rad18 [Tilletia horrida]|nr:E3 ubiquitin-protein ligase rad18 [Tilletia horrida]
MAPPFSIASALTKGKGAAEALDLDAASDPTDWVSTGLPFLKPLDSALRCTLCYDIYTAPVVLRECHHTFCSVCIRSHINQPDDKGRFCPQCRQKKVSDGELVPAQGLEEAAEAWKLTRAQLMKAATTLHSLQSAAQADYRSVEEGSSSSSSSSAEVEIVSGMLSAATPRGTKRKLGDAQGLSTPSPAVTGARRTRQSTAAAAREATGSSSADKSQKKESPARGSGSTPRVVEMKATDVAPCPICNQDFTLAKLNVHLDKGCDGSKSAPEPSPSTSRSAWFTRPNGENSSFRNGGKAPFEGAKKMVRPQYVGKSDRDMKKMLQQERLPTGGTHQRMVARHRQWVNIFNANLDAAPAKRQTEAQLRRALSEWDRGKDEEERNRARGGVISSDKAKSWANDHKSEFAQLVERARSSHAKNKDATRNMPIVSEAKDVEAAPAAASSSAVNGSPRRRADDHHDDDDDDDDDVEWVPNPVDRRSPPSGFLRPGSEEHEAELGAGDFFSED